MDNKCIFKRIRRKNLLRNNWFCIYQDAITINGKLLPAYNIIHYHQDSVIVIVIKEDRILFVNALRYTTGGLSLELPAGAMENDEKIIDSAKREVYEESGLTIQNEQMIYEFYPSNGSSDQKIYVIQSDYHSGVIKCQEGETVSAIWLSFEQIKQAIKSRTITDGPTLTALFVCLNT